MYVASLFAGAVALFWYVVGLLLVGYAVVYGFLAAVMLFRMHVARRCFRCGHLVVMNPRVKAVLKAYGVIFCSRCMPVGDQLAEVSREVLASRPTGE